MAHFGLEVETRFFCFFFFIFARLFVSFYITKSEADTETDRTVTESLAHTAARAELIT